MDDKKYDEELKKFIEKEFEKEKCLVAFLDILGFTDIVKKYVNPTNPNDKKSLEDIKSALDKSLIALRDSPYSKYNIVKYKVFSDCTSFSVVEAHGSPLESSMFCLLMTLVKNYNIQLMTCNIYPRGGISAGVHYEDKNMIFSESLIKAYTLESKKALYPRTILDDNLVKRFKKLWKHQKGTISSHGTHKLIIVDEKGTAFVNPFNPIYSTDKDHLESIRKSCKNVNEFNTNMKKINNTFNFSILNKVKINIEDYQDNEEILPKYEWLKELINWNIDPKCSNKFKYLL
ncbi:hypothetical protein [Methanobacterium sp.]|uniref:hypothetical protein n=1 Tax=Methanobacterium sp. TaxID=2164 RepID=UPI002AB7FC83|nr:hypothetical protein [Methanobacterium sp.]MDY9924333.1 hypothetical protein [Methanobacterium sp.]